MESNYIDDQEESQDLETAKTKRCTAFKVTFAILILSSLLLVRRSSQNIL